MALLHMPYYGLWWRGPRRPLADAEAVETSLGTSTYVTSVWTHHRLNATEVELADAVATVLAFERTRLVTLYRLRVVLVDECPRCGGLTDRILGCASCARKLVEEP